MKRALALFLVGCLSATVFSSCSSDGNSSEKLSESTQGKETTIVTTEATSDTTLITTDTAPKTYTTIADEVITPSPYKYVEFNKMFESQSGVFKGSVKEANSRAGASGKKYLSGFLKAGQDSWEMEIEVPSEQYYNFVFVIASDGKVTNELLIDGVSIGKMVTDGSKKFQAVGFENVVISAGKHKISVGIVDGKIDFDYFKITSSNSVNPESLVLSGKVGISNKGSTYKTKALYEYLTSSFGKNVISGQFNTIGTQAETDAIYKATGHYPAIRFSDMIAYTSEDTSGDDVEKALEWDEQNGIVGYIWHWTAPMGKSSCYAKETDFNLSKAVTSEKIATLSYEEISKLCDEGKVSKECLSLIRDIDVVSTQLIKLRDEGVSVIWRPLHEASGGWFWWGHDVNSYKWLWTLLYQRQTQYHKLNNLIWVWNGQNPNWYVGSGLCDVISADIYDDSNEESRLNAFLSLRRVDMSKPVALSECGTAPSIQKCADENVMWDWFAIWSGNYLIDEYGKLTEEFNTAQALIKLYSNNLVITRDELPDLAKKAEEMKKADEQAKKAKEEAEKAKQTEKAVTTVTTNK